MHDICKRTPERFVSQHSIPAFINEAVGADRGLICGFQLMRGQRPREILVDDIAAWLAQPDAMTWLHFNLSEARARRWPLQAQFLPPAMWEPLQEHDENWRIEARGWAAGPERFRFDNESGPAEVASLWCFASPGALITARLHLLKGVDDLRRAMRNGPLPELASGVGYCSVAAATAHRACAAAGSQAVEAGSKNRQVRQGQAAAAEQEAAGGCRQAEFRQETAPTTSPRAQVIKV